MEKIIFTNGQTQALNATNLNQLQTNAENAIATAKTEAIAEIPDIVDNLTTDDSTKILSAKQGKVLNDKITSANTYSTTETDTGKVWIDGKHIYRKVLTGTKANVDSSNLSVTVSNGVTGLDCYTFLDGFFTRTENSTFKIESAIVTSTWNAHYGDPNPTQIKIIFGTDAYRLLNKFYIVIEYTKTN